MNLTLIQDQNTFPLVLRVCETHHCAVVYFIDSHDFKVQDYKCTFLCLQLQHEDKITALRVMRCHYQLCL